MTPESVAHFSILNTRDVSNIGINEYSPFVALEIGFRDGYCPPQNIANTQFSLSISNLSSNNINLTMTFFNGERINLILCARQIIKNKEDIISNLMILTIFDPNHLNINTNIQQTGVCGDVFLNGENIQPIYLILSPTSTSETDG